ncbi:hypothetical protein CBR_g52082 [Chara braunii]|uniref:Myb/SANT-like DNA-binding domain-containing protein n=1 Tax=Chara braunii TaxID=69332 RepID=A0A388M9H3_CHABU|nr:hypothetical protein CBR_g52082 [Chara braunii]|eukprot:GBG91200.1 hypothetical protein CBR_g52082 [Chara braunii]
MAGRLSNGRPAGPSGGSINRQRSAGSVAKQPYDLRLYAHLPSHEIPLPPSDDEGGEARSPTLPLGSGSTQDWAATQSCGGKGVETPWSYTSLLNEGLCDDDGDAAVDLSFHQSSSSGAAATHTRIINPHLGGDCADNTPSVGGGDRNNSSPSVGGGIGARKQPNWMRLSPAARSGPGGTRGRQPAEDLIGGVPDVQRDGRQVWAECRQELHRGETETITRGVQRLHVDEVEDTAIDEGQGCDNVDDEDGCKSDDLPDIRPLGRRATRGGSGAKKGPAMKPRRTKNMDDDGEGGQNFWSVGDMVALVRAKRDQDMYIAGLGTSFARMKAAAWKWEDVRVRLQAMGVTRDAVDCGKKWDNLMQQFKKVHKFQNLSGGKDYSRLASRERRSEGFSFVMDRSKRENVPADTQGRAVGRRHVPKSKRLRSEEPSPSVPVLRGRYWAASNEDEDDDVFMTEEEAADDTVAAPRGSTLQAKNDQAAARRLLMPPPEGQQGRGQRNTKAKKVVVDVSDEDNEPLESRRQRNAMQGATATGVSICATHEERPPQGAMPSTPSQPRPRNSAADGGSSERGGGEVAQQEARVASAGAGAGSSGNVAVVAGAREEVPVVEREVARGENKGNRPRGYNLAFQYALESVVTDLARVMWYGEEWSNVVSVTVCAHTIDLNMDLPLWFAGVNINDRPEEDDMAAYQESTVLCVAHAFRAAVQMGANVDGGFISHDRLSRIADCFRLLLAACMWLMRMAEDDHCSHYEAFYFAQLVASPR